MSKSNRRLDALRVIALGVHAELSDVEKACADLKSATATDDKELLDELAELRSRCEALRKRGKGGTSG